MSDTPTPRTDSLMEEWHHCPPTKQLLNHSRQLERELAEAKVEINTWKAVAEARLENFHHYHDESLAYQAKLTAHKVALTKSYNILEEIVSSPFYQRTCRGGEMERLMNQAIKHLTSVNPNQPSQ